MLGHRFWHCHPTGQKRGHGWGSWASTSVRPGTGGREWTPATSGTRTAPSLPPCHPQGGHEGLRAKLRMARPWDVALPRRNRASRSKPRTWRRGEESTKQEPRAEGVAPSTPRPCLLHQAPLPIALRLSCPLARGPKGTPVQKLHICSSRNPHTRKDQFLTQK